MRVIGLDLGSTLGWSLIEDGLYIDGGIVQFKFGKSNRNQKWLDYLNWVDLFIGQYRDVDMIAYESVERHTATLAAHCYGFLKYGLLAASVRHSAPIVGIGVGEWKKLSCNNGRSDKLQVMAMMSALYPGVIWQSDDHSDSAGIATAAFLL